MRLHRNLINVVHAEQYSLLMHPVLFKSDSYLKKKKYRWFLMHNFFFFSITNVLTWEQACYYLFYLVIKWKQPLYGSMMKKKCKTKCNDWVFCHTENLHWTWCLPMQLICLVNFGDASPNCFIYQTALGYCYDNRGDVV